MGLISSLFKVASSRFSPTAGAPMLASWLYQSLPLFSFVFRSLLHCHVVVAPLRDFMEDSLTAVIAELFNMLSFCLNCSVKC